MPQPMFQSSQNGDSLTSHDPTLSRKDLEHLKARLQSMEIQIMDEIEEQERLLDLLEDLNLSDPGEIDGRLNSQGISLYQLEKVSQTVMAQKRHLSQIRRALRRMRDGTYGICKATLRPISRERLMSVPYAVLCEDALERGDPNSHHEER